MAATEGGFWSPVLVSVAVGLPEKNAKDVVADYVQVSLDLTSSVHYLRSRDRVVGHREWTQATGKGLLPEDLPPERMEVEAGGGCRFSSPVVMIPKPLSSVLLPSYYC